MEYFLLTLLIMMGATLNVMQNVKKLRLSYPQFSPRQIWKTFVWEEWDTMIVSFLTYNLFMIALFTVRYKHVIMPKWIEFPGLYIIALVWGYCGQRVAYKYLGTAEKKLEDNAKRIEDLKV